MEKHPLESQTIQGWITLFVPVIVAVLRIFDIDISASMQNELVGHVTNVAVAVIAVYGMYKVYFGRVKATGPLGSWKIK